jgi:hypothetical protein
VLDASVVRGEVPGLARQVLQRNVLELRSLAHEQLGCFVRVRVQLRIGGDDLLDEGEARAGICDHEQAPEERRLVRGAGDAHVERLLELHALRDVDEQAVLPDGGVVRRELLVPADERVEPLVPFVEPLERDPVRRTLDRDPLSVIVASPATSRSSIVSASWTCPGSDPGRV